MVFLVWEIHQTFPLLAAVFNDIVKAEAYVKMHTHNATVLNMRYFIEPWEVE